MSKRGEIEAAGFTLVEALIATAIAAALLASVATGLSVSNAGAKKALVETRRLLEAENIAARLAAGQAPAGALEGYPEWSIEERPYDEAADSVQSDIVLIVYAVAGPSAGLDFEVVAEPRRDRS